MSKGPSECTCAILRVKVSGILQLKETITEAQARLCHAAKPTLTLMARMSREEVALACVGYGAKDTAACGGHGA